MTATRRRGAGVELRLLLGVVVAALAISGIDPKDGLTWLLEAVPVLIALPLLVATRARFPLTPLAYRLIFAHSMLLILGAHYTFSHVPLGAWLQENFGFARNHYDRIVHFFGGGGLRSSREKFFFAGLRCAPAAGCSSSSC